MEGHGPGRPPRRTEAQQERLEDILDSGLVANGLDSGVWTSPMIAWVLESESGVTYHAGHVRKRLHKMDLSLQRPRRLLARADAREQDR